MAVVGAAFLGAMGLADAAVHVEHDGGLRTARMHPVDPGPDRSARRQGWRRRSATRSRNGPSGWSRRLADPARCDPPRRASPDRAPDDRRRSHPHNRPGGQTRIGATSRRAGGGVLAASALRQRSPANSVRPERIVQFTIGQQSGIGGDAAAVKFQLQAAVKIDPQRPIIRFTRWVFHELLCSAKNSISHPPINITLNQKSAEPIFSLIGAGLPR
jgi:hypothetical protein